VGAAAANRVICSADAGKTPTRFSFFDNLALVSVSFLYFLLAVLPECCFSVLAPGFHRSVAKLISSFGRSFNFQGTLGKYPQYIGSEKAYLWIPF